MAKIDVRNGYYGIVSYDKNGKEKCFTKKGKAINLDTILINIENNDIIWEVSFNYKGRVVPIKFARENIGDRASIKTLVKNGADITPQNINIAISSIMIQEDNVDNVISIYENIGWRNISTNEHISKYVYRAHSLIGDNGEYHGNYQLKPMGSLEGWREMIINEVLGRPALEVITLASLSAVVNGLISSHTTGENPIFHINAPTGTGKSSVGFVAASVFGEPFDGCKVVYDLNGNPKEAKSIYGSWAATPNAVIRTHIGNRGAVIILNELGKFESDDLTSITYCLSEGTDKNRLNEKYQSFVGEGFSTSIISIGESSMVQRCKTREGGIDIRVMEIEDKLTESPEHSRRLKDGSRKNNGWAASALAQFIIDNGGLNSVLDIYHNTLEELSVDVVDTSKHRFIEKYTALLITTAKLSTMALKIDFNTQSVIDFCDSYWEKKNAENYGVHKSFFEVLEDCDINKCNFYDDSARSYIPKLMWGKIFHPNTISNGKKLVAEYAIMPSTLRELLGNHGYNNPSTYLKKWRECGVLDCDEKHLTNKRIIDNSSKQQRVYVLQLWEEISEDA